MITQMISENLIQVDHPLIKKDMTILRCAATDAEIFRGALLRISRILAIEITKDLKLKETEVDTPLEKTLGHILASQVVLAPVLRAGLGMVNGFLEVIPDSKVGHIGLKRDEETLRPVYYYYKTPSDISGSIIIVLDPMLATGGSAAEALNYLKESGARDIVLACLVAAPEGVKRVNSEHPDVKIFTAALDRQLNTRGYILPGLGDAGDRIFGT
jgi:uracil phosphoribosyltransferase